MARLSDARAAGSEWSVAEFSVIEVRRYTEVDKEAKANKEMNMKFKVSVYDVKKRRNKKVIGNDGRAANWAKDQRGSS